MIKQTISSVSEVGVPNSSPETYAGPLTAQQGAGLISAKMCISIIEKGHYLTRSLTSGTVSKTFSVSSSDSWIRYSVAWLNNSSLSGNHTGATPGTITLPNLKLQIFNPSNSSVGSSNFTKSSVELVRFSTNSVTGTFTAKMTRMDAGTTSVPYAVAGIKR